MDERSVEVYVGRSAATEVARARPEMAKAKDFMMIFFLMDYRAERGQASMLHLKVCAFFWRCWKHRSSRKLA